MCAVPEKGDLKPDTHSATSGRPELNIWSSRCTEGPTHLLDVGVRVCNPSPGEVETTRSRIQGEECRQYCCPPRRLGVDTFSSLVTFHCPCDRKPHQTSPRSLSRFTPASLCMRD